MKYWNCLGATSWSHVEAGISEAWDEWRFEIGSSNFVGNEYTTFSRSETYRQHAHRDGHCDTRCGEMLMKRLDVQNSALNSSLVMIFGVNPFA